MTLPGDIGGTRTKSELEQHGARIRKLLTPDERLLDLTGFRQASGKDLVERAPSTDTKSAGRNAAELAAGIAISAVLGPPQSPSLKRMLAGVSATGQVGSWAYRLKEASWSLGKDRTEYLLVTDQRLLLGGRKLMKKDPEWAIALEIPRSALAQVEMDSRPFARGRVALSFTDGSMIALDLGTYRTGAARTLVEAITSPGTVTPLPV